MNRFALSALVFAVAALVGPAWADKDKAELQLRLEVDLVDGSRVIGTPGIESVPVQTSYAKMDVPLKQILAIKMGDDHESASLDLQNGDKLKGVVSLRPVTLETVFGKVAIGIEHIRELRVVLSGGALPEALKEKLVLYYSFDSDEDGTVTDRSGKNNNGEVHGAKWTPKGKVGGAYEFDGKGNYIDTRRDISGLDEISACGWSFLPSPAVDSMVVGQFGCGAGEDVWSLFSSGWVTEDGVAKTWVHTCLANDAGQHYWRLGSDPVIGKWRHVAFTYKRGSDLVLYEDGVATKRIAVADRPLRKNPKYTAKVGSSQGADGYWGSGLIDEVMIFARALTENEIRQIYDAQK